MAIVAEHEQDKDYMNSLAATDRRTSPRYDLRKSALISEAYSAESQCTSVHLRNISEGGIYFISDTSPDLGQNLQIYLNYADLDEGTDNYTLIQGAKNLYFKMPGEVVRIEPGLSGDSWFGVAIRFNGPVTLVRHNTKRSATESNLLTTREDSSIRITHKHLSNSECRR